MTDEFATYHPAVNFLYFALMVVFSMVLTHPLSQAISLACAFAYAAQVGGGRSVAFALKICLPMLLLAAVFNPAFNHEGVTVLLHFPTGNPLTLESLLYGLSAGTMIVTMLLWFVNFNRVVTSDKFVYLFGRIAPALSLILSMTLRFVPRFKGQMDVVSEAQRSMGVSVSEGGVLSRARAAVKVVSIMVTWALESAIETADSMKSRGYGLKGRTAFSIYRFDGRDKAALAWLCGCSFYVVLGCVVSAFGFRYFPSMLGVELNVFALGFYGAYFGACIMPVAMNAFEERKWRAIRSSR